jgi:hypothetical protein
MEIRQALREQGISYQLQCAARDLIAQLDAKILELEGDLLEANSEVIYLEAMLERLSEQGSGS